MDNKQLKPKIRFKWFGEKWSNKQVKEFGNIVTGYTPSRNNNNLWKGNLNWISAQDLNKKYVIDTIEHINYNFANKMRILPKDSLIVTCIASIGLNAIITKEAVTNQQINGIICNQNFDKEFLYYLFEKNKESLLQLSSKTAVPIISKSDFEEIYFNVPKNDEQKQIGEFFENIDNFIALNTEKLEKIKNIKKSFLSKMFPKPGSRVPELRFKGFGDEWEENTIDYFGSFYYGRSAPKWSVTKDATTPCIRYGEMYTRFKYNKVDKIYSFTNMPSEKLVFSTGTEVLIPRVGEDPSDYNHCLWLPFKNVAIGEMISVYNTKNNPLFTATMFNATLKNEFSIRVEGGTVTNLYYEKLKDIKVAFPSIEEQIKISNFFESLNKLIIDQENKLEKLKHIKQSFLSKMFV